CRNNPTGPQHQVLPLLLRAQLGQLQRLALWSGGIIATLVVFIVVLVFFWQRRKHRDLKRLSRTDQLTGLPNRHRIMNFLSEAIRSDTVDRYVLMLLDLDYFKHINDEHGHDAGDRALLEVAEEMRAFADHHNLDIGRWGGEEFLILFQAEQAEDAARLTTELLNRIASIRTSSRSESEIRLTASAGFAPLSSLRQTPDQRIWEPALLIADQLLYRAKKAGRNGFFGVWPTNKSAIIEPHHLDEAIESGAYRLLQRSA
ncbi:MAG: GGDEF domain-containing protein, partial [Pseudomonadota bacterium]